MKFMQIPSLNTDSGDAEAGAVSERERRKRTVLGYMAQLCLREERRWRTRSGRGKSDDPTSRLTAECAATEGRYRSRRGIRPYQPRLPPRAMRAPRT